MEDGQKPEAPPAPPDLQVVRPRKKHAPRVYNGPMTRERYEELAQTYMAGNRSPKQLHRKHHCSEKTARKAINEGWPEHDWPPLKERAKMYDRIRDQAAAKEDPERAKQARDFLQMRDEYLRIAHALRGAVAQCLAKLVPEIAGSTATTIKPVRQVHYEEVLDASGKVVKRIPRTLVVDVTVPPSIFDIAPAVHQMTGALDRIGGGELEQLFAKPPSDGAAPRKHNLNWQQIEYMAANGGRMPPGTTLDDLGDV